MNSNFLIPVDEVEPLDDGLGFDITGIGSAVGGVASIASLFKKDNSAKIAKAQAAAAVQQAKIAQRVETEKATTNLVAIMAMGAIVVGGIIIFTRGRK